MPEPRLILRKITDGSETAVVDRLIVGRGESCGLMLGPGGSREHALFSVADAVAAVEDLGSTNGTFINGRPVRAQTQLAPGDRIRFDVEEFEFLAQDAPRTVEPVPPPPAVEARKSPGLIAVVAGGILAAAIYLAVRFLR